jgi:ATP-dependent protease ClpP protease subunit
MPDRRRSPFHRAPARSLVRALDDGDAVELLLYDEIGFWGITAKQFAEQLATITAGTIHLRVNSPGGDVFDGVAIFNALRAHPAQVITHIDGLAASIASVIALAGDEVRMAPNAFFMIHNPWGITIGDAQVHRKMADTLDKIADSAIASTYRAKSGQDAETVETWMNDETWFTAAEAEDAGFVDVVEDAQPADASAAAFDLSIYQHVPPDLRDAEPAPRVREAERRLREAGFSRQAAKAGAAAAIRALAGQRDAGDGELVASEIRQVATNLLRH